LADDHLDGVEERPDDRIITQNFSDVALPPTPLKLPQDFFLDVSHILVQARRAVLAVNVESAVAHAGRL
jgi:hypothetical protein